jgi:ribosomal protein L15
VGRGEASKGKTAVRGTKGTKRPYQVPAAFEGGQMPIHMRLPKLKGFKNPFKVEFQVVNLDRLSELFPRGRPVGVDDLVAKGPSATDRRARCSARATSRSPSGQRHAFSARQGEDRRRRRQHHRESEPDPTTAAGPTGPRSPGSYARGPGI